MGHSLRARCRWRLEKVYATEDLIINFDTINYGFSNRVNFPSNKGVAPAKTSTPQSPGSAVFRDSSACSPVGRTTGASSSVRATIG